MAAAVAGAVGVGVYVSRAIPGSTTTATRSSTATSTASTGSTHRSGPATSSGIPARPRPAGHELLLVVHDDHHPHHDHPTAHDHERSVMTTPTSPPPETSEPRVAVHRGRLWSTTVDLVVTDPGVLVAASRILHEVLTRVEATTSRFRDDSELSRVHTVRDRGPVVVSPDLYEALSLALDAAAHHRRGGRPHRGRRAPPPGL